MSDWRRSFWSMWTAGKALQLLFVWQSHFFSAVENGSSCCVTALFTVAGVTEAHVGRGFRGLRATKTLSRVIHKVACCGLSSSLPAWRTASWCSTLTLKCIAPGLIIPAVYWSHRSTVVRHDNSCVRPEPGAWLPDPQRPRALHQDVRVRPVHRWNWFQVLRQALLPPVDYYFTKPGLIYANNCYLQGLYVLVCAFFFF